MLLSNLNFHHLYYFWTIATEGSIVAASRKLRLAQPTLSTQLKQFEDQLQTKLFERSNRQLKLTEAGHTAKEYADDIFGLGEEFIGTLRGVQSSGVSKLRVGVIDSFPKHLTYELLAPLTTLEEQVLVSCFEGKRNELLSRLVTYDLDLVLTDAPIAGELPIRAYNHSLGSCSVTVFAASSLAKKAKSKFPDCLEGLPVLLPTPNTMLRKEIDNWLDDQDIIPNMIAEFEDSALMKVFASKGEGMVFLPSIMEEEAKRSLNLRKVYEVPEISERAYLVSLEKRVKHPLVTSVVKKAKDQLFAG